MSFTCILYVAATYVITKHVQITNCIHLRMCLLIFVVAYLWFSGLGVYFFPVIFNPKSDRRLLVEDYVLFMICDAGGELRRQLMSKTLYCMLNFVKVHPTPATKRYLAFIQD